MSSNNFNKSKKQRYNRENYCSKCDGNIVKIADIVIHAFYSASWMTMTMTIWMTIGILWWTNSKTVKILVSHGRSDAEAKWGMMCKKNVKRKYEK